MSTLPHDLASTAVPVSTSVSPTPTASRPENRLLLYGISWKGYRKIADAFTGIRSRVTYDRGKLEIMTNSSRHETWTAFLGRLVEVLSEETNQPILNCGEMTCEREDLDRAIEPDECFYLTVWRFDGETVVFLQLNENREYVPVTHSRYFPFSDSRRPDADLATARPNGRQ